MWLAKPCLKVTVFRNHYRLNCGSSLRTMIAEWRRCVLYDNFNIVCLDLKSSKFCFVFFFFQPEMTMTAFNEAAAAARQRRRRRTRLRWEFWGESGRSWKVENQVKTLRKRLYLRGNKSEWKPTFKNHAMFVIIHLINWLCNCEFH